MKYVSNFIFVIIIVVVITCLFNNHIKSNNRNLTNDDYINSNEYYNYIVDTIKGINNNNIFEIGSSGTRFQHIEFDLYSKNKMTYNDFDMQVKDLAKKLYEKIKDKNIKKNGILSYDDFIISLNFYEKFNSNINPNKQNYILVGFIHIDVKDLEKYRTYNKCVSGGISDLEWQQERK